MILQVSPFYEFQLDIIRGLQSIASDGLTFIVELITMVGEEYIAILEGIIDKNEQIMKRGGSNLLLLIVGLLAASYLPSLIMFIAQIF